MPYILSTAAGINHHRSQGTGFTPDSKPTTGILKLQSCIILQASIFMPVNGRSLCIELWQLLTTNLIHNTQLGIFIFNHETEIHNKEAQAPGYSCWTTQFRTHCNQISTELSKEKVNGPRLVPRLHTSDLFNLPARVQGYNGLSWEDILYTQQNSKPSF